MGKAQRAHQQQSTDSKVFSYTERMRYSKPFLAFSLLELMMSIAILGIIAAIGVPAYRHTMNNAQAAALSTAFSAAINYARTEAIHRGASVSICASANTSQSACGAATQWTNGWLIFVDSDANGSLAASTDILLVHEALPSTTSFTASASAVVFNSMGIPSSGTGTYTMKTAACTGQNGRTVTVASTGRVSTATATCAY